MKKSFSFAPEVFAVLGEFDRETPAARHPVGRSGRWIRRGSTIIVLPGSRVQSNEAETAEVSTRSFQLPKDVIDPRLDVGAQKALLRMFKGDPGARADATGMLAAVKDGQLAGIYGDDLLAAVKVAQRLGTQRWLLVPKGEDAALLLDPAAPMTAPPTIIFRGDTPNIRYLRTRLDPALRKAWQTFLLAHIGELTQCAVPQSGRGISTRAGLSAPSQADPASNVVPPILCKTTDPADSNLQRWFLTSRPLRSNNNVKYFIHVPDAYAAMAQAIEATSGVNDFIYLLGWDLGLNTPMATETGKKAFGDLLIEASNLRGVPVRCMLNLNQMPGKGVLGSGGGPAPQNGPTVDFINNLANGGAVHDNRYLNFGSHHQKVLVVKNETGLVAFCGGMDIDASRQQWHDVHCRITGPATLDLHRTFSERWLDHPHIKTNLVRKPVLVALTSSAVRAAGELRVQIVRTYGNGNRHAGLAIPTGTPNLAPLAPRFYSFAPNGEHTIYDLIANAIRQTKEFIYIEDQYLVCSQGMRIGREISKLLADKVAEPDFKKLVILIARTESIQGELFQAWRRRQQFIRLLMSVDPSKVTICQYKIDPGSIVGNVIPRFVHAKTWIFDDKFAVIGSANCNRRGYSHDSEVAAGIFDENPNGKRRYFAHDLRIDLWDKHLNAFATFVNKRDLLDPIAASKFWSSPDPFSAIELYNDDPTHSPAKNPGLDRRVPISAIPPSVVNLALSDLNDDWDVVIDPDGS